MEEKKKSNAGKYLAIGCGSLVLIAIIVAIVAFFTVKGKITGMVDQYTDTQPMSVPASTLSAEELGLLRARFDTFKTAIQNEEPTEPLIVSADELNALIQDSSPDGEPVPIHLRLEGERLEGDMSLPLDFLGPLGRGRYVNGAGELSVSLADDRLHVAIETLEVNGEPLPEEFLSGLRQEDLGGRLEQDTELGAILQGIATIDIVGGRLVATPKLSP